MPTTQSEDPSEKIAHPRHYNQHVSNIETIELIEHLPYNLGAAVKYIWRCGLKPSEEPLRELGSARWYTEREEHRIELYELDDEPKPKTDVVWRSLARKVIAADPNSILAEYLISLLGGNFEEMLCAIDYAMSEIRGEVEQERE